MPRVKASRSSFFRYLEIRATCVNILSQLTEYEIDRYGDAGSLVVSGIRSNRSQDVLAQLTIENKHASQCTLSALDGLTPRQLLAEQL